LIPTGGIYIAGGISSKNIDRFLENNLFMTHFEDNYNNHIIELLKEIPVYVIMDYGISLLGAANAAINLSSSPKGPMQELFSRQNCDYEHSKAI
jgi:glucokinase